jgi:hypothetical protein
MVKNRKTPTNWIWNPQRKFSHCTMPNNSAATSAVSAQRDQGSATRSAIMRWNSAR